MPDIRRWFLRMLLAFCGICLVMFAVGIALPRIEPLPTDLSPTELPPADLTASAQVPTEQPHTSPAPTEQPQRLLSAVHDEVWQVPFNSPLIDFSVKELNCRRPATMASAMNLTFQQDYAADTVARFQLVLSDETVETHCTSILMLRFNGTDSKGRLVMGIGRVDCNPATGIYHAAAIFPVAGKYRVELQRFRVWCLGESEEGGEHNRRGWDLVIHEDPQHNNHTTNACQLQDLASAELGYFYQLPNCSLPHCEGVPRKSRWRNPGMIWSPYHCHLRYCTREEVVTRLRGKSIMFLGDSTMDEMVEGIMMIGGVEEDRVMGFMYTTTNYTDASGTIHVQNLHRHRLIEAQFLTYNITFSHRYMGHHDLTGKLLGTDSYKHKDVIEYIMAHFGPDYPHPPDLVVFNSGRHDPATTFNKEVEKLDWLGGHMVELASQVNTKLLWRSTNVEANFLWGAINAQVKGAMQRHGIPVVDVSGPGMLRGKNDEPVRFSDGIHFGLTAMDHGATSLDAHEAMTQIMLQAIFEVLNV